MRHGKLVLLLVDDDELLRRVLVRGIKDAVDVVVAGDITAAKVILQAQAVDVVASDFAMGGGTGSELLEWVELNRR